MAFIKRLVFLTAIVQAVIVQGSSSTSTAASTSKTASTQSSTSTRSSSSSDEPSTSDILDDHLANDLLIALAAFAATILVFRLVILFNQHIRHLACLNNGSQRYFAIPNPTWASIKRNILHAPLFRLRHNNEFRFSSAVNMGTLPSRFQTIFMVAIIATNVILCIYDTPWSSSEKAVLPILRNRTGTLATVNLIPMVIMAGRNNPLIGWLNVSYDSFNMMHRLFGRILTVESIAHTLCWMIAKIQTSEYIHSLKFDT